MIGPTSGPKGGSVLLLAVDPQDPGIIYAGTGVGVFKSKDGGASWNNAGLNGFGVSALIIDPQTPTILYARAAGPDVDVSTQISTPMVRRPVFRYTDCPTSIRRVPEEPETRSRPSDCRR